MEMQQGFSTESLSAPRETGSTSACSDVRQLQYCNGVNSSSDSSNQSSSAVLSSRSTLAHFIPEECARLISCCGKVPDRTSDESPPRAVASPRTPPVLGTPVNQILANGSADADKFGDATLYDRELFITRLCRQNVEVEEPHGKAEEADSTSAAPSWCWGEMLQEQDHDNIEITSCGALVQGFSLARTRTQDDTKEDHSKATRWSSEKQPFALRKENLVARHAFTKEDVCLRAASEQIEREQTQTDGEAIHSIVESLTTAMDLQCLSPRVVRTTSIAGLSNFEESIRYECVDDIKGAHTLLHRSETMPNLSETTCESPPGDISAHTKPLRSCLHRRIPHSLLSADWRQEDEIKGDDFGFASGAEEEDDHALTSAPNFHCAPRDECQLHSRSVEEQWIASRDVLLFILMSFGTILCLVRSTAVSNGKPMTIPQTPGCRASTFAPTKSDLIDPVGVYGFCLGMAFMLAVNITRNKSKQTSDELL